MPSATAAASTSTVAGSKATVTTIQCLRALAALMVVWHHTLTQVPAVAAYLPSGEGGSSGVDLFFVISGFIMVYTTVGRPVTPRQFLYRRIIRVVPLYWLLTLTLVGLANLMPQWFRSTQTPLWHVVESLLFIPHWSPSHPGRAWPVMVPGWTLNYEMLFYGLFAVSLWLPQRWRYEALSGLLCLLATIGLLAGEFSSAPLQEYTRFLMVEFAFGMMLAKWWLRRGSGLPLLPSSLLLLIGIPLLVSRDAIPLAQGNQAVGAALVVTAALSPSFLHWQSRLWLTLGDASYSIYLTHLFTLGALRELWRIGELSVSNPAMAIAYLMITLVASSIVGWLTMRWLERPLLAVLRG